MSRIALSVLDSELPEAAEYCGDRGLGIEVTAFAFPGNLGGGMNGLIRRHRELLKGISPISVHGPFFDLVATSMDPLIVEVARSRHLSAMEAASSLGAEFYVAHTNYTPVIRNPGYREGWTGRMLDFWLPLADRAAEAGMTICFENLWEPTPEVQLELLESARHDNMKATLDNGHVLVFSHLGSDEWVRRLGEYIVHMHLHDNGGETDQHLPAGQGIEDWGALLAAVSECAPEAVLVAESGSLAASARSMEMIRAELDGSGSVKTTR